MDTKNVQHMTSLINKGSENLMGLGCDYNDIYYVHILPKGIGPSFSNLIRSIRQQGVASVTLDDCIAQAFTEEMTNKQHDQCQQPQTSAMRTGQAR